MGTQVYLGMPPPSVVEWIKNHHGPKLDQPLFFEANEPGASVAMLCFDDYNYQQTSLKCHLQYSTDKMATWAAYDGSIVELDNCVDGKVYFRADPENPNTDGFYKDDWDHEEVWTHYFKTNGSVKGDGNIQFLLESTGTRTDVPKYGFYQLFGKEEYDEETDKTMYSCSSLTTAPILPATNLADYCYSNMFRGGAFLTNVPTLPATTLAKHCYSSMFNGCSSLMTAPSLPATTLANNCYLNMFSGCTSLTSAPELPVTTLADGCYFGMFNGCSSLMTAPSLPATILVGGCYHSMFDGCSSLTTAPILPATTLANNCYHSMFRNCSLLTSAPKLPATTLANNCYWYMFQNCMSLTTAPELPATILANNCYQSMFSGCLSLTEAPELPAMTLVSNCYSYMFTGCTSLTSAPELPATTLISYCYNGMFSNCSKLASMDVNFTAWNPSNATGNWMNGAGTQATGTKTFICPAALPKTTGNNNIPTGWTIVEK